MKWFKCTDEHRAPVCACLWSARLPVPVCCLPVCGLCACLCLFVVCMSVCMHAEAHLYTDEPVHGKVFILNLLFILFIKNLIYMTKFVPIFLQEGKRSGYLMRVGKALQPNRLSYLPTPEEVSVDRHVNKPFRCTTQLPGINPTHRQCLIAVCPFVWEQMFPEKY